MENLYQASRGTPMRAQVDERCPQPTEGELQKRRVNRYVLGCWLFVAACMAVSVALAWFQ